MNKVFIFSILTFCLLVNTWGYLTPTFLTPSNAIKIQDVPVSSTAPTLNQLLQYDGTNWVPTSVSGSGSVTVVSGTLPISVANGTTAPIVSISQSSGSTNGYLSSTDWTTFNNKFSLPALTSGSVLFSNGSTVSQDNANFFWDNTNKRLGLNQNGLTPSATLDVHQNGSLIPDIQANNIGAQSITGGANIQVVADPGAAILSGNRLGVFQFAGATDAAHTTVVGAAISALATENFSGSTAGTKLNFSTTANGTQTRVPALTIDQNRFVGISNQSPTGSLDVSAVTFNPGTIAVTGTTVTGTSTQFTRTFKPGDLITTTTSSGFENKSIQTITSDTVMTTAAFAGTNSGAAYTSSNTGSQFVVNPNGTIRLNGTGSAGAAAGSIDAIYKADTLNFTGAGIYAALRDSTVVNSTGAASVINTFVAQPMASGTGSGSFSNIRGFNAIPTVSASNTGNITNVFGVQSNPSVTAGATGTITSFYGLQTSPTNNSTTNTISNMFGLVVNGTQTGGTLTNYAGVAVNAKPAAATNSSLLLLGTTTVPSGNYSIYNSSTADNYFAGSLGIGIVPAATTNVYLAKNITGGTTAYGFLQQSQVQSATVTGTASYFHTAATTSSGTTANLLHYETQQGAFTGTVTNQIGYRANSTLTGGTNNYGFLGDIASGAGRYNFYAGGTAQNYFAGKVGLATTNPAQELDVNGNIAINGKLLTSKTAPTIASGFCTSPTVTNNNGTAAFTITIGSACAVNTGAITLPTAAAGWSCTANNLTSNATYVIGQTATTTTSASFAAYSRTTGVASNWTTGNVIQFQCLAY